MLVCSQQINPPRMELLTANVVHSILPSIVRYFDALTLKSIRLVSKYSYINLHQQLLLLLQEDQVLPSDSLVRPWETYLAYTFLQDLTPSSVNAWQLLLCSQLSPVLFEGVIYTVLQTVDIGEYTMNNDSLNPYIPTLPRRFSVELLCSVVLARKTFHAELFQAVLDKYWKFRDQHAIAGGYLFYINTAELPEQLISAVKKEKVITSNWKLVGELLQRTRTVLYCQEQEHSLLQEHHSSTPPAATILDVTDNRWSLPPREIFQCGVPYLCLDKNPLQEFNLPFQVEGLKSLDLQACQLRTVPKVFFTHFPHLFQLKLTDNLLTEAPCFPAHVTDIYLDGNPLEHLSDAYMQYVATLFKFSVRRTLLQTLTIYIGKHTYQLDIALDETPLTSVRICSTGALSFESFSLELSKNGEPNLCDLDDFLFLSVDGTQLPNASTYYEEDDNFGCYDEEAQEDFFREFVAHTQLLKPFG